MYRHRSRSDRMLIGCARLLSLCYLASWFSNVASVAADDVTGWNAGVARAVITPEKSVWLAGYGSKRPPDGKLHDWWSMARALEAGDDRRKQTATDRIRPEIVAPESAWTLAFAAT